MTATQTNSRHIAWAVWIVASIFYAYQYVLRVMPNIMLADIMQQFGMNATHFGQFSGVYYIGYSLMHLPVGMLLDRFGPKRIMAGCILLSVAGMAPLLFSSHYIFPIIGRFLMGVGSSCAILGVFTVIRMAFKEAQFSRMLSFSVTIGLLGAIYGGSPVRAMLNSMGYQEVLQIFALAGIALALLTYWIVPHTTMRSSTSALSNIKEVMGNGRVIWSCIFAGLMMGPIEGFADVWGCVFLERVFGYESTLAASLPSIIFIGMCFGAPLLSYIAEKTANYPATIIGAGVVMAASFFAMCTSSLSPGILSVLFALIGISSAYQILAIYKASTYVGEHVAGLTTAIANMIIMIFGYAFHSAMGGIVNAMGGPTDALALRYGVSVVPIALSIGSLGFILLEVKKRAKLSHVQLENTY